MTMENGSAAVQKPTSQPLSPEGPGSSRRRSGSGGGILSRFPFLRNADSKSSLNDSRYQQSSFAGGSVESSNASEKPARALASALSQQSKTRRRRGSLRKVALLSRGAVRDKRDPKVEAAPQRPLESNPISIDTSQIVAQRPDVQEPTAQPFGNPETHKEVPGVGLGLSDETPRPSMEGFAPRGIVVVPARATSERNSQPSPVISYASTTDEEDGASLSLLVPSLSRQGRSSFSSQDTYLRGPSHHAVSSNHSIQRRRSMSKQKYAKSPLSLQGLATASPALGAMDTGPYDYSETEWWGWVVLVVTWFVFILGMGSCFDIWSWAWDVGSTPYAPPELEDDPTLPIVGYYPALLILTSIMAWVWVIVAWVGMKYFRHAKITGD
ncbi:hypothetical protein F5Y17DRAFT_415871 [Xylariaceae sp. FL0594]|nr:hypothetical protein F5Y17DRAFT_415871 [Xylariaceae sp. FL0594]